MKKVNLIERISDDFFIDRHANIKTDVDALLSGGMTEEFEYESLNEAIVTTSDLYAKLRPLGVKEIESFMATLGKGTFFKMGIFSLITPNAANKHKKIYKISNIPLVVSGTAYENAASTQEFRDKTGTAPKAPWYDHKPGFENKIGVKKSAPDSQYVLFKGIKGKKASVWYFIVDTLADTITPVSLEDLKASSILTQSVKDRLQPESVEGVDINTGEIVVNDIVWRTVAFEHIFWLSQKDTNLGTPFLENLATTEDESLTENGDFFIDRNADVHSDVDELLQESSSTEETCDMHETVTKNNIKESYRRTVSRGTSLIDNELFVDFE